MNAGNPIADLAAALASACYVDFDEYEYEDRDWSSKDRDARVKKKRRPGLRDIEVAGMFAQTWGSTALGFGGIGGQAISSAYTIVLCNNLDGQFAVYFAGRHAYTVRRPNQKFVKHLAERAMLERSRSTEYEDQN